ncbi:MAG TPA: sigma-70 family RNA polymerase sigma factor [Candidatus Limnocylindria bacterium]|nr:sigma-70 family RNA polymerase sigma factor [Candidatus Limnocylindria bacterium]
MTDDMELVRQYARENAEEAFATLVSRHVNLVYSVALRLVRDPHLASEVTQTVFIILARKAGALSPRTIVAGWLCQTARHTCAKALTQQHRRQQREQEAFMQSHLNEPDSEAWRQIEPLLDTAMAELGEQDHHALVLRYFEGRNFKDVSVALGTSEAGAKMRVSRALEKLRKFFARRGLTFTAAAVAGAVAANSVQAAPPGLAATVTAGALKGTAVTASTFSLLKTTLKLMAWSKLKTAVVVTAAAFTAVGTAIFITHHLIPAVHRWHADRPAPFTFAGYATPEASVQSMLWAGSRGDFKTFTAGCTKEQTERFLKKMAGKSEEQISRETTAWANTLRDYKITRSEVISDDEVHLHIEAKPSPDGLRNGKVIVVMQKIGDEWKQAGDL